MKLNPATVLLPILEYSISLKVFSPEKRTSQRKQMATLRQEEDAPYCLSFPPSFNRKSLSSYGYSSHIFQPSRLCNARDRQIIVVLHYKTSS